MRKRGGGEHAEGWEASRFEAAMLARHQPRGYAGNGMSTLRATPPLTKRAQSPMLRCNENRPPHRCDLQHYLQLAEHRWQGAA